MGFWAGLKLVERCYCPEGVLTIQRWPSHISRILGAHSDLYRTIRAAPTRSGGVVVYYGTKQLPPQTVRTSVCVLGVGTCA